jgi:hypothetical protein
VQALAYHSASRCLLALCEVASPPPQAPGAQSHALRLVHADSLRPVLSMALAPGHYTTCLLAAPLPCASAAAAGRGGQGAGGGAKQFVVLGSYLLLDGAAGSEAGVLGPSPSGAPVPLQQGVLSFFEVRGQGREGRLLGRPRAMVLPGGPCFPCSPPLRASPPPTPAAARRTPNPQVSCSPADDGSNATAYSLLLRGTAQLPAVPNALAVATPLPGAARSGTALPSGLPLQGFAPNWASFLALQSWPYVLLAQPSWRPLLARGQQAGDRPGPAAATQRRLLPLLRPGSSPCRQYCLRAAAMACTHSRRGRLTSCHLEVARASSPRDDARPVTTAHFVSIFASVFELHFNPKCLLRRRSSFATRRPTPRARCPRRCAWRAAWRSCTCRCQSPLPRHRRGPHEPRAGRQDATRRASRSGKRVSGAHRSLGCRHGSVLIVSSASPLTHDALPWPAADLPDVAPPREQVEAGEGREPGSSAPPGPSLYGLPLDRGLASSDDDSEDERDGGAAAGPRGAAAGIQPGGAGAALWAGASYPWEARARVSCSLDMSSQVQLFRSSPGGVSEAVVPGSATAGPRRDTRDGPQHPEAARAVRALRARAQVRASACVPLPAMPHAGHQQPCASAAAAAAAAARVHPGSHAVPSGRHLTPLTPPAARCLQARVDSSSADESDGGGSEPGSDSDGEQGPLGGPMPHAPRPLRRLMHDLARDWGKQVRAASLRIIGGTPQAARRWR